MKKLISVALAFIIAMSCMTVAFAGATYSGTWSDDVTITGSDNIEDNTVFTGNVTNTCGILSQLSKGTYKGTVTNNGYIAGGSYYGTVYNTGSIIGGNFYGSIVNTGKIYSGNIYNVVTNNGGTVTASAIIYTNGAYTVQGAPTVNGSVKLGDGAITIPSGTSVTVADGATLTIANSCTLNGTITVKKGGRLVLDGSLVSGSEGQIYAETDSSVSGSKSGEYEARIYRQYKVTVQSNVDLSEFDISVNLINYSEPIYVYSSASLSYSIDWSATNTGCLTLNSVTLYNNRKSDSNRVESQTSTSGTFVQSMPKNDVVIYVDCTVYHQKTHDITDATCTTDGKDVEKCSVCGHVLNTTIIPKLGHSFSDWVRNTDTSSKMLKSRTCSRCGYVDKAYVEIIGYNTDSVTVDYKSKLTFHYNVSAPEGCAVYWKINDGNPFAANPNGYTVNEAKESFTITAIVMGSVYDTYTVKVNVKNGFFDKIIAFFRGLFNANPVYVDGVKK